MWSYMAKTLDHVFIKLVNHVQSACEKTCLEVAQETIDEVSKRATLDPFEVRYSKYWGYPNMDQFATYKNNFKVSDVLKDKNKVSIRAYNDYRVWFSKLKTDIPFGYFIEYGTGRNASGKYDYTDEPWDKRTVQQGLDTGGKFFRNGYKSVLVGGTFGMSPQPHWEPSIQLEKAKIKQKLEANL